MESNKEEVPGSGVYVTEDWETAGNPNKAIPHVLFDGDYHQLIVEVVAPTGKARRLKKS